MKQQHSTAEFTAACKKRKRHSWRRRWGANGLNIAGKGRYAPRGGTASKSRGGRRPRLPVDLRRFPVFLQWTAGGMGGVPFGAVFSSGRTAATGSGDGGDGSRTAGSNLPMAASSASSSVRT
jgi:hypothetical protein